MCSHVLLLLPLLLAMRVRVFRFSAGLGQQDAGGGFFSSREGPWRSASGHRAALERTSVPLPSKSLSEKLRQVVHLSGTISFVSLHREGVPTDVSPRITRACVLAASSRTCIHDLDPIFWWKLHKNKL